MPPVSPFVRWLFLSPCSPPVQEQGSEAVRSQIPLAAARMTSTTKSGWESMGTWLLSMS
jgi:hypothetical protein